MLINMIAALALLTPVQAAATVSQKILLPVVIVKPVPGALGSLWSSRVDMYYGGSLLLPLVEGTAIPCFFDPCLIGQGLAAGTTYTSVPVPMSSGSIGKFLYVRPAEALPDLAIYVRVFDISRPDTNRGTQIPVVLETAASRQHIQLLSVAIAPPFRSMLRIYDFDPDSSHAVLVRILLPSSDHDLLLDTRSIPLRPPADPITYPGYAELDLSYLADRAQEVRVEIAPATDELRFWAFVSTTNNQTQHVTLITP
jgi:hypothetical protein